MYMLYLVLRKSDPSAKVLEVQMGSYESFRGQKSILQAHVEPLVEFTTALPRFDSPMWACEIAVWSQCWTG